MILKTKYNAAKLPYL